MRVVITVPRPAAPRHVFVRAGPPLAFVRAHPMYFFPSSGCWGVGVWERLKVVRRQDDLRDSRFEGGRRGVEGEGLVVVCTCMSGGEGRLSLPGGEGRSTIWLLQGPHHTQLPPFTFYIINSTYSFSCYHYYCLPSLTILTATVYQHGTSNPVPLPTLLSLNVISYDVNHHQ